MKKFLLLSTILLLIGQCADAGILTSIFGRNPNCYHNGYYNPYNNYYTPQYRGYNSNIRQRLYNRQPHYYNNYYNQRPIIYRTNFRKSMDTAEKFVSNRFDGIDRLEKRILNETFKGDTTITRIERLEQQLFGATQNGSLDERFELLQNASKNYKAFAPQQEVQRQNVYSQYRPPIFTGSTGSNWRNMMWGNFRNQFTGMPTGFTPAMDPAYMDYFEMDRATSSGFATSEGSGLNPYRRQHFSNVNTGSGAGVTILD